MQIKWVVSTAEGNYMKLQTRLRERYGALTQNLAAREAEQIHRTLDLEVVRELCDHLSLDAAVSGEALSINGLLHNWRKVACTTSTALLIGGFGSLLMSGMSKDIWQKFYLSHAAAGCWYLSKNQKKILEQSTPVIQLLSYLQISRSTQELSQLWEGKSATIQQQTTLEQPIFDEPITTFDWGEIESNPNQFPPYDNIVVLGLTHFPNCNS